MHHLQVASHIYFFPTTRNAYLFVEFFFVLSGFVIAHAYADRLNGGAASLRFMIKRFGRVWPLHVVMLLCFIAAETALYLGSQYAHMPLPRPPFSEDRTLLGIPINLVMLNGLIPYIGAGWNAPSWSVSVELAAYLLFALSAMIPGRSARIVFHAALIVVALCMLCVVHKVIGIERCVFSFFIGTFVWRFRAARVGRIGTAAELVAVGCAIAILLPSMPRVQFVVAPLVFAGVIFVLSRQAGKVSAVLRAPFALRLGLTSYSIYMVHFFIAFAVTNVIKVGGRIGHQAWVLPGTDLALIGNSGLLMDAITIAYLAVVILVAKFTYRYIERPGIAWFGRLADTVLRVRSASTRVGKHCEVKVIDVA
ncbi:acyltransferase family protein [Sphingomonas sp. HMP9]|uniref:acyltransferase family protein n=1 Tax=Sphingomonas sp. HMP9 TaxID=1517554 RepID=UPI001E2E7916|nr:acyltransferase [Sphingomonas sp. HMP9]